MSVAVDPVADVSRITARPPALPLIAVTPAGLKGAVGPTGFIKAGSVAPPGVGQCVRRPDEDDEEYFHRAMQESMDLRDQGHA